MIIGFYVDRNSQSFSSPVRHSQLFPAPAGASSLASRLTGPFTISTRDASSLQGGCPRTAVAETPSRSLTPVKREPPEPRLFSRPLSPFRSEPIHEKEEKRDLSISIPKYSNSSLSNMFKRQRYLG